MPGILSDKSIEAAVRSGSIQIDPWTSSQLNPTSYDLTLGTGVTVYDDWVEIDKSDAQLSTNYVYDGTEITRKDTVFNLRGGEPDVTRLSMGPERGWLLKPGIGYLMHTQERITTSSYVPIVDGKSSIGRLFIQVHITAGYGDPAFDGQYTLEVVAQHPIRVFPGMRIAQIRFHTIEGEVGSLYSGNYVGERALGAVPSRAWRQFQKEGK